MDSLRDSVMRFLPPHNPFYCQTNPSVPLIDRLKYSLYGFDFAEIFESKV